MVIDRGNFLIVDNDLKFTLTWEMYILGGPVNTSLSELNVRISQH